MVVHASTRTCLASVGALLACLVTAVGPTVAAPSLNIACGTVKAAHWTTGGKSGNTWIVTAAPATGCALAKASTAMLTNEKSGVTSQMAKTPHGYVCTGKPIGALPLQVACVPRAGRGGFDITASGYRF
jgi:hypothetical protein